MSNLLFFEVDVQGMHSINTLQQKQILTKRYKAASNEVLYKQDFFTFFSLVFKQSKTLIFFYLPKANAASSNDSPSLHVKFTLPIAPPKSILILATSLLFINSF